MDGTSLKAAALNGYRSRYQVNGRRNRDIMPIQLVFSAR
jgi:hypothetical protein